jgi:DNA invertase Pin-like site-specific DNA recombinase
MNAKPRRAALYLRVSSHDQSVDMQRAALLALCEHRGWDVVAEFSDNGISGANGRKQRPGLDAMLKAAHRGAFDVVLAWALDRIGRSLRDLLDIMADLEASRVDLVLHQQSIDTTTPAGRMLFQIVGSFAEFERSMIRDRVTAGLARARAKGVRLGRPRVQPRVEAAIRARLARGESVRVVAKACRVGIGTVYRVRDAMAAARATVGVRARVTATAR